MNADKEESEAQLNDLIESASEEDTAEETEESEE